ncbi:hypothetical protein MHYP_G00003430 [Metynnis hypsauchen]
MQSKTTERIQTHEMKWQELRQAVEAFKLSADEAVAESDRLFAELIHSMEKRQCEVKGLILAQKEALIKQAEELIENIQQQITELKKRHDELQHLEQLFQEHDNIRFLENSCSISPLMKLNQIPVLLVHPYCSFEPATDAVSEVTKKLNLICQWQFITISERVKNTGIVSSPLPRTRQELLKYASKLTLDPDTVHDNICLSLDNMLLTAVRESEYYPFHPQRFERRLQALCQEGLRGSPRYWEVKCGAKGTTHDVISIEVEVAEAHIKLGTLKNMITDRIKTRQKEVQELEQAVEAFKTSAENAMEESEKLLTELIHSMEKRRCTVQELIRAQEETVMMKANEVLDQMQEELAELKRRDADLQYVEQLSEEDNDICFLQGVSSVPALPASRDAVVFFVHPYCSFELSTQAVSDLIKQLNLICKSCFTTISEKVKKAVILSSPAPKKREDFLQYASKLTLNLNTAHVTLHLSNENREMYQYSLSGCDKS